jgi:N-acetylglucosamine kinase-like BadF-type ATPase
MKVFAGIDGGGTRTRLALVGESGMLVSLAVGGSCSFTDIGLQRVQMELIRLWHEAWSAVGMKPRPADAIFMGLGSILSPQDAQINCELAVRIGLAKANAVFADNDVWNAHAGGLAGLPGILLISGTGSACFGRNSRGESWRTGGWGHLLKERGSAHALGHAALVAATRDADGRGQSTALKTLVCEALDLRDLKEIFRKVHQLGVSRKNVAGLAPRVVALAESGDPVARQILADEADGLVEMTTTVARQLGMESPDLALTGGLISNATAFRRMFLDSLARALPSYRLVEDGLAPVFGAVLLAVEHGTCAPPAASFLQTLHKSSVDCLNLL